MLWASVYDLCSSCFVVSRAEASCFMNDGPSAEAWEEIHRLLSEVRRLHSEGQCKLRKLIFHNNMSGDGGCVAIANILRICPYMEEFQMSTMRSKKLGGASVVDAFPFCPMLRKINLSDNTFGVAVGKQFASILGSLRHLECLNLSDTYILDEGAAAVLQAISECAPPLSELYLGYNELTPEGIQPGLAACVDAISSSLEVLSFLGNVSLGNRGARIVSRALIGKAPNLRKLEMVECEISGRGALALAKCLGGKVNMRSAGSLLLDENMISAARLEELNAYLERVVGSTGTLGPMDNNTDDESSEASDGSDVDEDELRGGEVVQSSIQAPPVATSIFGAQPADKPGTWKCPGCDIKNDASDAKCVCCMTPQPGLAEPESKVSGGSMSFGGSGITFGGMNPGETVAPNQQAHAKTPIIA